MHQDPTVLLIDEDPAALDSIRGVLGDQASGFKLRRIADVPTALARIWGGGIDLVAVKISAAASSGDMRAAAVNPLAAFHELRQKAPDLPVVILCDPAAEGLARTAVEQGAAAYLQRGAWETNLLKVLRSVAGKAALPTPAPRTLTPAGKRGKTIAFIGAKGGVGTTTVAMNVATVLAASRRVILIELHAELGSLRHYFEPHRSMRDIGDLLAAPVGAHEGRLQDLESYLWPVKNVPGLEVLFGPRGEHAPLEAGTATCILEGAAEIADYVIVDLPVSLSAITRAVVENSDCLALVAEREPISVHSAKLMLGRMDSWQTGRLTIGTVVLNRAALVSPMPFAQIDAELCVTTLGVIPPAADLCAAAQHAHTPMLALDGNSLASVALRDLTLTLEQLVPAGRPVQRAPARPLVQAGQQAGRMAPTEVR